MMISLAIAGKVVFEVKVFFAISIHFLRKFYGSFRKLTVMKLDLSQEFVSQPNNFPSNVVALISSTCSFNSSAGN